MSTHNKLKTRCDQLEAKVLQLESELSTKDVQNQQTEQNCNLQQSLILSFLAVVFKSSKENEAQHGRYVVDLGKLNELPIALLSYGLNFEKLLATAHGMPTPIIDMLKPRPALPTSKPYTTTAGILATVTPSTIYRANTHQTDRSSTTPTPSPPLREQVRNTENDRFGPPATIEICSYEPSNLCHNARTWKSRGIDALIAASLAHMPGQSINCTKLEPPDMKIERNINHAVMPLLYNNTLLVSPINRTHTTTRLTLPAIPIPPPPLVQRASVSAGLVPDGLLPPCLTTTPQHPTTSMAAAIV